jgi:hypothetical protein
MEKIFFVKKNWVNMKCESFRLKKFSLYVNRFTKSIARDLKKTNLFVSKSL